MMWIRRTASGAICGAYANRQEGYAEEELALLATIVIYINTIGWIDYRDKQQ